MSALPPGEPELTALMLASLDGDARAYRALLEALRGRLRTYYARRMGRDAAEAEDLVQETLIALHAKRATFDRAQPVSAWVYAIARYKLIDHYRRSGRSRTVPLEDDDAFSTPDESAAVDARRDIERGMEALSPRARDLVRAVKLEQASIAETAQRTGMSETAVKVAVHRGYARLAARLRALDRGTGTDEDAP